MKGYKNTARWNERKAWKVDRLIKRCISRPYDYTLEKQTANKSKSKTFFCIQGPVKRDGAREALG